MFDFFKNMILDIPQKKGIKADELRITHIIDGVVEAIETKEFAELYARQIGDVTPAIPNNGLGEDFNQLLRKFIMSSNTAIAALAASLATLGQKINQSGAANVQQEITDINTHLSKLDSDDQGLQGALQGFVNFANGTSSGTGTTAAAPTVTALDVATGAVAGGTTVTLTGTGFTGATAVLFGTQSASSVNVISDTQLSAVSPAAAAGAVDVTVVAPGGTSAAVPADQFTYA